MLTKDLVAASSKPLLLSILAGGESYGYEIIQKVRELSGGQIEWSDGMLYPVLHRLERDGLIESDDDDERDSPQKRFRISAVGGRELARWLRTPPDMSSPPRDELVIKVLVALRVPGTDVAEVIQAHRRYLIELMQQWTRIKEADAGRDLALGLAVDAELFRLDAVVRWLDAADGRIKRAAAEPPAPVRDNLPKLRNKTGVTP